MPMVCSVCSHDDRRAIEKAVMAGKPIRRIAKDSGLTESSLGRHVRDGHILRAVNVQAEKAERVRTIDVAAELAKLLAQTEERLARDPDADRDFSALAAVKAKVLDLANRIGVDMPVEAGKVTVRLNMAGAEPDAETG